MEYQFKKIEEKWQKQWDFKVENPNYYVLSMWPYPSGKLHMGHLRNYLIGDVLARFKTMQGFTVLHPMGWDAFGLPAENAAIERASHPKEWTLANIANMREELKKIGFSFDWSREETSCLPEYYKHEQKMFLEFLKKDVSGKPIANFGKEGIAYKKESVVNWDPVDNTVLANEQVIDGKGWRSGAIVEKRLLSQWFLRVSGFSSELLEGLKGLTKWPEKVKTMQENWIGRSEGSEIDFEIEGTSDKIKIFTTRPETLYGASFVAVSYAHPIASVIPEAQEFIKECEKGSTKAEDIDTAEKKGFFTGLYAINPVNGGKLPVYIANFVLMEYGTGALFGCPAHDARDYEFALKYDLPIKSVINAKEEKFTKLETENLTIRPFNEGDLADLTNMFLELNQNPHWVKKPEPEETVKKEAKRKLEMYIKWQEEQGFSRFAVVKKDTNELIGGAGFCFFMPRNGSLNPDAKKTDIELGYWFLEKFHGKGFGKEAIKAVLDWAEESLPYTKIVAVTDPENKISQKILQNLGFTRKGEMFHQEYGIEYFFYKTIPSKITKPILEDGVLSGSGNLNGLPVKEAREKMFEKFGKKINFRLKDWGVSRQRYWGCPIPIINCSKCGIVPVPENQLPVTLPEDITIETGENPLKKHPTWRFTTCPKCGDSAEKETDTLDTFFESSWYFLRFSSAKNPEKTFENPIKVNDYVGGIEHAILHLLYARFFNRALKKCGYDVPFEEPFERLITQGMVCHKTFQTLEGKWLSPEEAEGIPPNLYTVGASIKMSKSKKNVIEPASIVNKYGADTARFFMASDNPPERDMEWSDEGVVSAHKFLNKLWTFLITLQSEAAKEPSRETLKTLYKLLNGYREDIENVALNKAIAKIRELSNLTFASSKQEAKFLAEYLIIMIAPFCPHFACEIAEILEFASYKNQQKFIFPEIKSEFLEDDTCIISIQINGKLRGTLKLSKGLSQNDVKVAIMNESSILKHLEEKEVIKEIFVKDKIFSFVVK